MQEFTLDLNEEIIEKIKTEAVGLVSSIIAGNQSVEKTKILIFAFNRDRNADRNKKGRITVAEYCDSSFSIAEAFF